MKKLLLILIVPVLFSCSKDENSKNTETVDPIIGKWRPGKILHIYKDGHKETRDPDVCDLKTRYAFIPDNTIQLTSYVGNNEDGCELEIANYEYHTWGNLSNNVYLFKSKHPNEPEEQNKLKIKFPEEKIMVWVEEYSNGTIVKSFFDKRY